MSGLEADAADRESLGGGSFLYYLSLAPVRTSRSQSPGPAGDAVNIYPDPVRFPVEAIPSHDARGECLSSRRP